MELVVGMGEYIVTNKEDDIIKTFALASCVAVTVYSPVKRVAGMIHIVLPYPFDDRDRNERPGYFAETGIPLLLGDIQRKYACTKEELYIQIFGGADSKNKQDVYHVGKKNINAVKCVLNKMGLTIRYEELRGYESRTLIMEVKSGQIEVYRQPIII